MFFDVHREERGVPQYYGMANSSTLPPFPDLTVASNTRLTHTTKEARQHNDDCIDDYSPDTFKCNRRLSSLNVGLSKQLQKYMVIPQSHDCPTSDTDPDSPSADDSSTGGQKESLFSKLLGDALSDTSNFLSIIQSYSPKRTVYYAVTESSSDTTLNTSPHLGTIIILNLLSVYLQIVMIYDKLFQCFSEELCDVAEGSITGLRELSGLQRAELSAHDGDLQTKILIHAILHQFEMIERILGLPPEFRVTEKRDDGLGLFGDEHAKRLLEAMSNGKQYHGDIGGNFGLKPLCSLREKIERVQISLNM
jgi:hypothetical protein